MPREAIDSRVDGAAEEKLLQLQNSVQGIERKIRQTETEMKTDTEETNSDRKKNEIEIKRLKMEIQELEVHLERCQKTDENMVSKEFQHLSRDIGNLKGKSAKEILRQMEAEGLELQKGSLQHELEMKARTLRHITEELQEMRTDCNAYFENEPTEYHSIEYIRELENEYQKISKYITESEIVASVLKQMKSQLEKTQLSNAFLLEAVQREYAMTDNEMGGENALTGIKKEVRFLEDASDQECELMEMKANFEKIREATGVSVIQDVENRFLEQQSTEEKLSELKRLLSRTLLELRAEKKQVDSKMELLQGARCPERELCEELSRAKTRLREQERRKERTALELERSGVLLTAMQGRGRDLLQKMDNEMPSLTVETNPNITVLELMTKLEDILAVSWESLRERK